MASKYADVYCETRGSTFILVERKRISAEWIIKIVLVTLLSASLFNGAAQIPAQNLALLLKAGVAVTTVGNSKFSKWNDLNETSTDAKKNVNVGSAYVCMYYVYNGQTFVLVARKRTQARWKEGRSRGNYNIVNNPGQLVLPGGGIEEMDDMGYPDVYEGALKELCQETGYPMLNYQEGIPISDGRVLFFNDQGVSGAPGGDDFGFGALYIRINAAEAVGVLARINSNLQQGNSRNPVTHSDELYNVEFVRKDVITDIFSNNNPIIWYKSTNTRDSSGGPVNWRVKTQSTDWFAVIVRNIPY